MYTEIVKLIKEKVFHVKHRIEEPFEVRDTESMAHELLDIVELTDRIPYSNSERFILIMETRDYPQIMKDLNDRSG